MRIRAAPQTLTEQCKPSPWSSTTHKIQFCSSQMKKHWRLWTPWHTTYWWNVFQAFHHIIHCVSLSVLHEHCVSYPMRHRSVSQYIIDPRTVMHSYKITVISLVNLRWTISNIAKRVLVRKLGFPFSFVRKIKTKYWPILWTRESVNWMACMQIDHVFWIAWVHDCSHTSH